MTEVERTLLIVVARAVLTMNTGAGVKEDIRLLLNAMGTA